MTSARPLGLYLHVPFCSAICNYCNFNRGLLDEPLRRRYVDALVTHITREADGTPIDTIYFGGGTPSLLDAAEIGRILDACRRAFAVAADTEVTLEANPETVDRARLEAFREAGVNRLSFGVQSFRDEELKRLGRLHDAARAAAALGEARQAGFDNVSLDLMMWLPAQRVEDWLGSVDRLIGCGPEHASLYLLEIYPNAPLRDEMARAGWSVAPDEDASEMYLEAMARLDRAGYEQYEISNVARPGQRSRHNLKYWSDGEWLAFGCGAHGTRHRTRFRHVSSTHDYVARVERGEDPRVEQQRLTAREAASDAIFMGLRLADGVDLEAIGDRYGCDPWHEYGDALAPSLEAGLAVREGGRLRLTRDGMLLANEIMCVFV